jgi:hypothetical protein
MLRVLAVAFAVDAALLVLPWVLWQIAPAVVLPVMRPFIDLSTAPEMVLWTSSSGVFIWSAGIGQRIMFPKDGSRVLVETPIFRPLKKVCAGGVLVSGVPLGMIVIGNIWKVNSHEFAIVFLGAWAAALWSIGSLWFALASSRELVEQYSK